MALTLSILRPFLEEKKAIEWIRLECPGGSFMVGEKHRPLVNVLAGGSTISYKEGGSEREIVVPETGGLVHVVGGQVILFLHSDV